MLPSETDVVVVGGGNAALCAAASAAEHGIRVLVLARAGEQEAGGNSRLTTGAIRCVYDGVDDLKAIMPDPNREEGETQTVRAEAVVLAGGGFQATAEWRTRYLGRGWDLAKVRGTRFNTGDGIRMALDAGAMPTGNWSGCHAVGWDRNAPEFGDLDIGDNFQKHSYPFAIMINADGERFVDEGADFRNYTYAKYGRVILSQPGQFAWQIFDRKVLHLLRDEYRIKRVTKVSAATLEELVDKLDDVNPARALATIKAYNAAIKTDVPFNPNVKDGRCTMGLAIPKSNWANVID